MAKPVKCGRCGRENDPSFSYCLDCGQSLKATPAVTTERICSGCGARLPPGFRFCGHCGRAAGPSTAPAGVPSPAAAGAPIPLPPAPAAEPRGAPVSAAAVVPEEREPRLSLIRQDGQPGAIFPLAREVTICGRTAGEALLADDLTVSPRHARFTVRDQRVTVEDLGTESGTFVRIRAPRPLAVGDEIRLGRQLLRLEPLPRPAAPPGATPWGSPDKGCELRLSQLLEGGGIGEVFPLQAGENAIGREAGDVTFPFDRYVSARHARIDVGEGSVTLTDLGSSNGIFVRIAGPIQLQPGDQILIGAQLLRLDA